MFLFFLPSHPIPSFSPLLTLCPFVSVLFSIYLLIPLTVLSSSFSSQSPNPIFFPSSISLSPITVPLCVYLRITLTLFSCSFSSQSPNLVSFPSSVYPLPSLFPCPSNPTLSSRVFFLSLNHPSLSPFPLSPNPSLPHVPQPPASSPCGISLSSSIKGVVCDEGVWGEGDEARTSRGEVGNPCCGHGGYPRGALCGAAAWPTCVCTWLKGLIRRTYPTPG